MSAASNPRSTAGGVPEPHRSSRVCAPVVMPAHGARTARSWGSRPGSST
ncbi:hypothetical protein QJS66_10495 [Kocuria rhizophila]|nr:hypothetical protein QJS66_10495 [Kocuria rhizophila]